MLHANGKYDEAANQYEAYMNETRDYLAVANDFRSCKLAIYLQRQPSPYTVSPVKLLNTVGSELVGDNRDKKLYLATRGKHGPLDKPQKSTKRYEDYDLMVATKKGSKRFISLEKVKGKPIPPQTNLLPVFLQRGFRAFHPNHRDQKRKISASFKDP